MQIRLAIVDDNVKLAKNLKSDLLEFKEIESIITASSGIGFASDLEQMTPDKRPHVIVMDISMATPDEGIHATRLIKKQFPEIEIVMFTVSDEDDLIFEAFKAGALGYLLKNETPDFILKTILDVKSGGAQMSPAIARKTIRFLAPALPDKKVEEVQKENEAEKLSVREIQILEQVSKGTPYKLIASELSISLNTVKKHMENIFNKLRARNKIEALKKAEGYFPKN